MGGYSGPDAGLWPLFQKFVGDHADRIRGLIATRGTQTNEVRRAALLYPAVALAAEQAKAPIGLLEVGCSAGLLLDLDRYGYRYRFGQADQVSAGPAKAKVVLDCPLELEPGTIPPRLPRKLAIAAKIGLDADPIDVTDEESAAWLEACVWADQPERQRLLLSAIRARPKPGPELIAGDAIDDLPAAAARIDPGTPLVIMTSNVLAHLEADRRPAFVAALAELAAQRPLWWVSHDLYEAALEYVLPGRDDLRTVGDDKPFFGVLGLTSWTDGEPQARALATTNMHGRQLSWLES